MGVSDWVACNLNRTPRTYTHTHTHIHTHIHTYICIPCTTIMHLHRIQNTHICSTQYAHNPHTHRNRNKQTKIYAAHTIEHLHNLNTGALHTICTYIVLIFITYNNISKNSITQLYTKLIHFARLINKVSKITIYILKILYRKLLYHDIDKPYILLFN